MSEDNDIPSSGDILRLLDTLQTAVDATAKSSAPLLKKAKAADESLDLSAGISLLLVRPQLLLASLHHLVVMAGIRLSSLSEYTPDAAASTALGSSFASSSRARNTDNIEDELAGELALCHEVMDKVRGMEAKLEYQIKKLVGLAEADAARGKAVAEDVEEDPLSFRPNPSAMVAAPRAEPEKKKAADGDEEDGVYRPPRVAAMPYNEPTKGRKERRAPALLSEFAAGLDGAPAVQTTTGLSTRPVLAGAHTNSASAKRAAELKRIQEFEEDNMTRLVTTKREAKRRRDDEEALALGFGVGGRGRLRRQNGLEAELEGVLGERGSKGVWDGVSAKLGKRDALTDRGKRAAASTGERKSGPKKARFEKDLARKRRAIGL
ncbi:Neuroguidin [Vanrija pseudolonga]|uniref:Neuroguidin n=1 Tax=Vanrija pseudolonga TaxID=143232 RepID=A0AAF0YIJ1_9TREE|nr:Neuroguidin [Vanrija pseudolonga]